MNQAVSDFSNERDKVVGKLKDAEVINMKLQLQAFAHRSHFSAPKARKIQRNSQNIHLYFMLNHEMSVFNSLVTIVTGIALSFQIRTLFRLLTHRS